MSNSLSAPHAQMAGSVHSLEDRAGRAREEERRSRLVDAGQDSVWRVTVLPLTSMVDVLTTVAPSQMLLAG